MGKLHTEAEQSSANSFEEIPALRWNVDKMTFRSILFYCRKSPEKLCPSESFI